MSIKVSAKVKKIIYYNHNKNWGIVNCVVVGDVPQDMTVDYKCCFVAKGSMAEPILNQQYKFKLDMVNDEKYGLQYNINTMMLDMGDLHIDSNKRKFLEAIFTPLQVQNMYNALEDPFEALRNKDCEQMIKVKGCGQNVMSGWFIKFDKHYDLIRIYTELEEYQLTAGVIKKLLREYKSVDLVIEKVKYNPYILTEVSGVGWKTVDAIALNGGIQEYDIKRVGGYILYYLNQQRDIGSTWVTTDELMSAILENIGMDVPDENIASAIYTYEDRLWWDEDKTKIGLQSLRNLEERIADEFIRLKSAPNRLDNKNWENIIKAQEIEQGWEYTDQQMEAIRLAFDNNVIVIHGLAGTGKTTIVDVLLKVYKNYTSAMCALAGRAGARLAEVSGEEGYTIHRLLGFPKGDEEKNHFLYNDDNQLPFDIIVVDEISMIGGRLFYSLLRAIQTGTKVILLGDIGQLESIGECKVAVDIINSSEIPTVYLNKIHRQAAKSAIITESIKMRNGQQIIPKDYTGVEVRGELQDLEINIFSDISNTFYNTMQYVSTLLSKGVNILDMQVIAPRKEAGDSCTHKLNLAIQLLYNPNTKNEKEVTINKDGRIYSLRVGDKIINVQNNKETLDYESGEPMPIFNGNIGIIYDISDRLDSMIIDFENIGRVEVAKKDFFSIELGYAITVHKMQGDQKDYVVVAIDNMSWSMLSRELLYTAVTRAKKKCFLVAQTGALRYATNQQKNRIKKTSLENILYEKTHPKLIF